VFPETRLIIGGTHPSSLTESCLQENPEVDFVAAGEGDELIVELARRVAVKNRDFSGIKDVAEMKMRLLLIRITSWHLLEYLRLPDRSHCLRELRNDKSRD
jgi:radical SAM superfamily enzyme YgiQ (UPF0313 family)